MDSFLLTIVNYCHRWKKIMEIIGNHFQVKSNIFYFKFNAILKLFRVMIEITQNNVFVDVKYLENKSIYIFLFKVFYKNVLMIGVT